MKLDWVAEWFSTMRECGENISIIYGYKNDLSPEKEPVWYELPHDKFDGISGLASLLRAQDCKVDTLPVLRNDSYTFLRGLRGFFSVAPTLGIRKQAWIASFDWQYQISAREVAERLAWNLFSEEETLQIISQAKAAEVTLNTYLLFHLDAVVRKHLTGTEANRCWMLPVNLRGVITRETEASPHMSYLGVELAKDISLSQLQSKITGLKKDCFHWGTWTLFKSLFLLGKSGIRKDILDRKKKHHGWTGTFSNLGNWNVVDAGHWIFCPTVSMVHPVGAGCITMNGRLAITMQLHEALNADLQITWSLINSWKLSVLAATSYPQVDVEITRDVSTVLMDDAGVTQ